MRLTDLEKVMFDKGYLTVHVIAAKLKCSSTRINRLGNSGDLEDQVFIGQQKFIPMESVLKWAGKDTIKFLNLNDWSDVIEFDDPAEPSSKKTATRR